MTLLVRAKSAEIEHVPVEHCQARPGQGMTWLLTAATVPVAVLLGLELLLQGIGLGSFPLFDPAVHGAYRMRPDKHGRFMRRCASKHDANGMRNDRKLEDWPRPPCWSVTAWPMAASASTRADRSPLRRRSYPGKLSTAWLATAGCSPTCSERSRRCPADQREAAGLGLESGDFDAVGTMGSELGFPTRRPTWLTLWPVRRQAYRRLHSCRRVWAERTEIPERQPDNQDLRNGNLAVFRKLLTDYAGLVATNAPASCSRGSTPKPQR